jgi:hypothetical protein
MICNLVGSTARSARLDPEDMRAVIDADHAACAPGDVRVTPSAGGREITAFLPEQAGASGRRLTDHLFNRNWAVRG